jgi:hypothetical protein
MSKEAVEAVIGKALLEADFHDALLADPDQALAGFDLTSAEIACILSMDNETMEYLSKTLDERTRRRHKPV